MPMQDSTDLYRTIQDEVGILSSFVYTQPLFFLLMVKRTEKNKI